VSFEGERGLGLVDPLGDGSGNGFRDGLGGTGNSGRGGDPDDEGGDPEEVGGGRGVDADGEGSGSGVDTGRVGGGSGTGDSADGPASESWIFGALV
jgi:hypothetical protein